MKIREKIDLWVKRDINFNFEYGYFKDGESYTIGVSDQPPKNLTHDSPISKRMIELANLQSIVHDKFDELKMNLNHEIISYDDEESWDNMKKENSKGVKRGTKKYNNFKRKVKERDGKCVCCGWDKDLCVHHVLPYGKYPETQADADNGVTLCMECHRKYEELYRDNISPVTLIEFIKNRTQLEKCRE